jgi:hypothetical protein
MPLHSARAVLLNRQRLGAGSMWNPKMSTKLREFLDRILPGSAAHSDSESKLHVSANGTSTVPAGELEKIVFERFREMDRSGRAAPQGPKRK